MKKSEKMKKITKKLFTNYKKQKRQQNYKRKSKMS